MSSSSCLRPRKNAMIQISKITILLCGLASHAESSRTTKKLRRSSPEPAINDFPPARSAFEDIRSEPGFRIAAFSAAPEPAPPSLMPAGCGHDPADRRSASAPPSRAVRLRPTPGACSGTADVMPGRFPLPRLPLLPSVRTSFCGLPRGRSGAYQAEAVPDAGLPS